MWPTAVHIARLGDDLEVRRVRRPTRTVRSWNKIAEEWVEREVAHPAGEYAVVTLTTYHEQNDCQVTARRPALVWNDGGEAWDNVRSAGPGEPARVLGYDELVIWTDRQGRTRTRKHFVITHYVPLPPYTSVRGGKA